MGSVAITGEEMLQTSFDDFQRQTSLMASCTLLWKELSDHFTSLEQDLRRKSEALKDQIQNLDSKTKESLDVLEKREETIVGNVDQAIGKVEERKEAALIAIEVQKENKEEEEESVVDCVKKLKGFCTKMDSLGFWGFVIGRKKEIDVMRAQIPVALADAVDPPKLVLEAISEVFPVDKREGKSERPLVTPKMKQRAKEIAEVWKESLDQRGGIENVKTPDVHTFLQHLLTFGIVSKEDAGLYRKLVVGSAWRKQMPKLAVSLGLGDNMEEMFPPVPLLKAYLRESKKVASSILEDKNNSGRAGNLAGRKEQSALRAVIKCIEEYKLEAEFPPESLRKRLEQLEKAKVEKKKPAAAPATKRTRASNGGPMPPAKAGRLTNAYVSSFPVAAPTFVRSPSHCQYPAAVPSYPYDRPIYGSRSPPAVVYSPEETAPPPMLGGAYPGAPLSYAAYGGYGNGLAAGYQQAYYR
ncbi:hypothetical protein Syun_029224 [Stephania yunnanensis]|uniref:FRIGIDA-like protein n=1 Tax=Stephania yunnanensis TaxID=152371 RepID=A0AAP0E4Z3_9MAGN